MAFMRFDVVDLTKDTRRTVLFGMTVQRATAEGIRLINESMPSDAVIKLKSLEAFAAAADGRATKIIIPSEIQGAAALAAGLVESAKGDAPNA